MKKAIYTVKIENDNAEEILNEIDNFLIDMEKKYANVQVEI